MADWRARLWGKSNKELRPGERALPFHLAPVIIVAAGALMVLVAMFMPAMSSADYATIADNSVIQLSPTLLLCSVAATIASVRYWRVGSSGSANLAILAGFWFFFWAVIDSQRLTVTGAHYFDLGTTDDGMPDGYMGSATRAADAGIGMWAAGVGSLLVAYGGLMMRFPHLSFGLAGGVAAPADEQALLPATKTCPKCAEKIKAAASVCRFCHHEFEQPSGGGDEQPQSFEDLTERAESLLVNSPTLGKIMTDTTLKIINDSTFVSFLPYAEIFEIAKRAGISLGGKLKVDDSGAGSLRFGFRWGINPTGLKVNIQFRPQPGGGTAILATGGAWDFGVGAARGRAILFEIARRTEADKTGGMASQASDRSEPVASGTGSTSSTLSTVNQPGTMYRGKSKTGAIVFCLIAGGLGVHRFYLGTWGFGIVFIGLTLAGSAIGLPYLGATLAVCDAIRLLVMKKPDFEAAYNLSQVGPFTL
jgi:hypothetical protein